MAHFGPLNHGFEIANHTFVLIDAPGLVEEDQLRNNRGMSFGRWAAAVPGGTIEFVERTAAATGPRHSVCLVCDETKD